MAKFPIYLELKNRRVVLIGGGNVAFDKAKSLLEAEARLVVVAKDIGKPLKALCLRNGVEIIQAPYAKEYIGPAVMLVAATNDRQLNEQIYRDCQEREILCNVVDVPDLCDFFTAAVVKRGNLQIAIGTDGYSPAYSSHLRKKLEQLFTVTHGQFLEHLHWARQKTFTRFQDFDTRKVISDQLVNDDSFHYFVEQGPDLWRDYAEDIINQTVSTDRG